MLVFFFLFLTQYFLLFYFFIFITKSLENNSVQNLFRFFVCKIIILCIELFFDFFNYFKSKLW